MEGGARVATARRKEKIKKKSKTWFASVDVLCPAQPRGWDLSKVGPVKIVPLLARIFRCAVWLVALSLLQHSLRVLSVLFWEKLGGSCSSCQFEKK